MLPMHKSDVGDETQPPAICNCLALRQAARHVTQLYDRHLAPEGLRTSQFSILAKLARLGPLSINELAGMMVLDRTAAGRAIRPLERDKLVTIGAGKDARVRMVRLTAAGRQRLRVAVPRWRQAQKQFDAAFGAAEAAKLRSVLARVISTT
jgi:DNA-binding MarR family transcriptional regulator